MIMATKLRPRRMQFTRRTKSCLYVEDGWPIAAKQVKESELDQFLSLVSEQDARILPVTRGRSGKRYKSCSDLADTCKEADLEDWPLAGVRTVSWCVDYLQRMGQTIKSHHEDFVRRCKLERNSWGSSGISKQRTFSSSSAK